MDSGFRITHKVFTGLKVVATYDFVHNDTNVDYDPGDSPDEIYHGTQCLGAIVGKANGEYVGVAPGAKVLLAKTEDVKSEKPIEEDNIVRALEWGEARGAVVVSASLGYTDWYTRPDFNGKTAISTKAVNIATEKGITCVIAAGNSGAGGIGAPADAFYAISVGAVTSGDQIADFSSIGPSADGRIKPEVCARGAPSNLINPGSTTGYATNSGTSFSTPQIAGVVALLLSARPQLTPKQVRDILMSSARPPKFGASLPNNSYGWGIVNASKAIDTPAPDVACIGDGNCNGNGICKSGVCECFALFYGTACNQQKISCNATTCLNGFCKDNTCQCFSGYGGALCALKSNSRQHNFPVVGFVLLAMVFLA